jgi:hypothetical protein
MGKGLVDGIPTTKCQIFHIIKRKPIRQPYNIHGHTLEEEDTAKYLGLNFQKSVNWNHHIDLTTKKANNATSFLQRNSHKCPRRTKKLCYMTLVRPLVEYSSIIWAHSLRQISGNWRWCSAERQEWSSQTTEELAV